MAKKRLHKQTDFMVPFSCRVPPELKNGFDVYANARGRSAAAQLRILLAAILQADAAEHPGRYDTDNEPSA